MIQKSPLSQVLPTFDDGFPAPQVPDHKVGRCIGAGAYGKVWIALNAMGEWRAVKAVYWRKFANDPGSYRREYMGLRRYAPVSLKHSSLLPILHVGRDKAAGCFFYIMELADAADGSRPNEPEKYVPKTLRQVLWEGGDRRRLPLTECVAVGSREAGEHHFCPWPPEAGGCGPGDGLGCNEV
jgi:hypothetical protein